MFPSRVAVYNDTRLVGSNASTASSNFDAGSPLYRAIAGMAALRKGDPALSRGDQIVRLYGDEAGLFAFSRLAPSGGGETLAVFNTGTVPLVANVQVDVQSMEWHALHGACRPRAAAPGSYQVEVAPLDFILCKAVRP